MSLPPILVDDASVAMLAHELSAERIIAVDLEADSLHSYQDKVCLIQISTPDRTVLVDPLAAKDLSPLAPVLADPAIRKIFHAADYDIRSLFRDFGMEIRGLFDTMIACQMLGEARVGLADVLGKYMDVSLDKRYQRADWSKRPLEEGMILYAAEDTRHLHRLSEMLEQRLRDMGRLSWAEEEFALLEKVRPSVNNGALFLRVKGAALLERQQLAVLDQLLQWRDQEACRRDRPPFKIVGNKTLLDMARVMPGGLGETKNIEGFSPRLADRYGRALLGAVRKGVALPKEQWPVYPRGERRERDPAVEGRMKLLKKMRSAMADKLAMDPGVLVNNAQLEGLASACPANLQQVAELGVLKNWQREVLGEEAVRALAQI